MRSGTGNRLRVLQRVHKSVVIGGGRVSDLAVGESGICCLAVREVVVMVESGGLGISGVCKEVIGIVGCVIRSVRWVKTLVKIGRVRAVSVHGSRRVNGRQRSGSGGSNMAKRSGRVTRGW